MPSRWNLTLTPERSDAAKPITANQLHAAVAHLVEPRNDGRNGDHHAQIRPYSVRPLTLLDDAAGLRIGWLDDTARLRLDQCFDERVRFGSQFFHVEKAEEEYVPYQALVHLPSASRALMTFLTATYFARAGRWYPLPDPDLLFMSLVRRWNTYAPEGCRLGKTKQKLLFDILAIADVEVSSQRVEFGVKGAVRVAFTGRAEFVLTDRRIADVGAAWWFATLSAYADLPGVGAQTTHGLGAVDVELGE